MEPAGRGEGWNEVLRDAAGMIEIARLHPSEFDLLKEVDDGFTPNPERSVAIAGRNKERIVSRLFVMAPAHVEGIFVDPMYRGGDLFKRMMDAAEIEARAEGLQKLFAYSVRPEIGHYIERRCGYTKQPWVVYSKELA